MTIPLLAAALAAQILPAPGNVPWERVADESGGPSFIDPRSLARDGDVARFLNRTDRVRDNGDGVRVIVARMAIDCRRRMVGFVEGDTYGEGGRFLRSVRFGPERIAFQPLPVGPGPDRVFRRVCGEAGRR